MFYTNVVLSSINREKGDNIIARITLSKYVNNVVNDSTEKCFHILSSDGKRCVCKVHG